MEVLLNTLLEEKHCTYEEPYRYNQNLGMGLYMDVEIRFRVQEIKFNLCTGKKSVTAVGNVMWLVAAFHRLSSSILVKRILV